MIELLGGHAQTSHQITRLECLMRKAARRSHNSSRVCPPSFHVRSVQVINLTISLTLSHNEHFIYALLERQHVFAPLRGHERFADLLENIDRVLEHFGQGLGLYTQDNAPAVSSDVWSVDRVRDHIRVVAREWSADVLRPVADLKFTYEQADQRVGFFSVLHAGSWLAAVVLAFQLARAIPLCRSCHASLFRPQEDSPEDFFTPYIWSLVYESSGLRWQGARVVLFPIESLAPAPKASDDALPMLSRWNWITSRTAEECTHAT